MQDEETLIHEALVLCRTYLQQQGQQLAVAESCTGGWISKYITDQPGSSAYYWGGVCSYANEAKQILLGVPEAHLRQFGAVSAVVAEDMVRGIVRLSGSDWGMAVTGIAGPDGGSIEKPVGLVYIAVGNYEGEIISQEYHFTGNREEIRQQTVREALLLCIQQMNRQQQKQEQKEGR